MGPVRVRCVYTPRACFRVTLPRNGGNAQLGCGLVVRDIKGHRYLYFWSYERGPAGSRRKWCYVGPLARPATRTKAADLLLAYHLRARREVDRRIGRLLASGARWI